MTGGTWYNTSICNKSHENMFEGFIRNARTGRYNIMCSINEHENSINHRAVMVSEVGVVHYQKIQQQKHSNFLVQP